MNEPQSECRIRFGTDWTAYPAKSGRAHPAHRAAACRCSSPAAAGPTSRASCCSTPICCATGATSSACISTIRSCSPIRAPPGPLPYLAGTIGVPFPASAGSLDDTLELTRARFAAAALAAGRRSVRGAGAGRERNPPLFPRSTRHRAGRGMDEAGGRLAAPTTGRFRSHRVHRIRRHEAEDRRASRSTAARARAGCATPRRPSKATAGAGPPMCCATTRSAYT